MTSHPPGSPAAFTDARVPASARAIILILHGGADFGEEPVDRRSLSWRRGRKLLRDIARPLVRDDIGVVLLRYRVRGWNARLGTPAPVVDARWALDELGERHDLPVVLLGHSMGGRTGAAVSDHPTVRGLVALAPWLPAGDPVRPLTGKVLRAAHGRADKITSAADTRRFVDRASKVCDAEFIDMGDVGHYLLRRVRAWNEFAVDGVRAVLDQT